MLSKPTKLKITLIGAGSVTFCPPTLIDIFLDEALNEIPLEICLMDISENALKKSEMFAHEAALRLNKQPQIMATMDLHEALVNADFVITAVEVQRNYFWSQDFHIPRKYGFRQIYGENGGPGGMFHTLRNMGPMLEIAQAMESVCPNAWLVNYTNPEAKLVEAISKLTKIKVVGLCHGADMGIEQLSMLLEIPTDDLDVTACGLNHFGWFQKIRNKRTNEDLYPLLREKERQADWLANWDEIGLSRILMRTFGLYPYPGTNHIGEYLAWSDNFLASSKVQYFYDPATENPWESGEVPQFVYSFSQDKNPTSVPLYSKKSSQTNDETMEHRFDVNRTNFQFSGELAVPIIRAITLDQRTNLSAVNMPNQGTVPGLPDDMVTEFSAYADGEGIHGIPMDPLPVAVTEMIRIQGAIHTLVIEAFLGKSRNKLLQAVLLDPGVSSYNNAVAMINEMCELQKEHLPDLQW